jgi:hypothetical protein
MAGATRAGTIKVIHRHRIGRQVFARVSELTYRGAQPLAVLSWVYMDDVRTPCVCVELDRARLRQGANRRLFTYDGVTVDPRLGGGPQREA